MTEQNNSTPSPQMWRRMLRSAFEPHVGMDGVLRAVSLWITQFSGKADMQSQVRPFVYAYSQLYGTFELRLNLTLQLLTLLRSPPMVLPEDPQLTTLNEPLSTNNVMSNTTQNAAIDDESAATARQTEGAIGASMVPTKENTLVTLLLKLRETIAQMPNSARVLAGYDQLLFDTAQSRSAKFDAEQAAQWLVWVQAPYRRTLACTLKLKQCTQIISDIYVYFSEQLGPVHTDECLNRAIHQCEDTPTGKLVSPRQFL